MDSLRERVHDVVDRSVAMESGTVVIDAGDHVVQWLASPAGVFHIEVVDPALHRGGRSLWQRLRGQPERTTPADFTERQVAALANLGFGEGEVKYQLRADDAGLDREHVVHVIVTVIHDVLEVHDASGIKVEIF